MIFNIKNITLSYYCWVSPSLRAYYTISFCRVKTRPIYYPYECLSEMMKYMETLELTEEEKEKVFHLNAEKYILNK